uniref:Ig-like domain-containing protein n=1 Tax=Callorhinchus milii TaxID=7868 RepID=A0A4W3GWH5_CALMI
GDGTILFSDLTVSMTVPCGVKQCTDWTSAMVTVTRTCDLLDLFRQPRLHGSFLNSTVSILNIDSTAIEDTGKYICYVNGIKRRAFTFFVCVPFSKIVMGFEPEKPVEGDHIQITCQAGTGFPKPLVQWLAAGNDITHKANIMMGNSIDHKILVRTSVMVKAKRGVRYTCSIWNKYIENLLVDWVVPVPGITVQTPIKDILGIRGKSVLLICDIDIPSNDPVTIAELGFYWVNRDLNMTERLAYSFVNEKQHLEEQDPMFAGRASLSWENFLRGSADLKLANVSIDDMGDYICRVKKVLHGICGEVVFLFCGFQLALSVRVVV